MNSDLMISASKLTKQFTVKKEKVNAVTDLDLEVRRGELVAFLGPNGAGKTTSLRMLTTLLPPTSGKAIVAGHNVLTESAAVRRRIGYVGQGNSGGHNQRVRDEMISQGAFYGMSRAHTIARTDELLESLDLAPLAKRAITALSGGQRRRLDIALGLVHSPELMFLDEPSTGLDPQSRANLWQHILDLRASHGTTVFVTTHYLEEADQYAERVLVMDHGRVIADDTGRALKTNLAGDVIRIGVDTGATTAWWMSLRRCPQRPASREFPRCPSPPTPTNSNSRSTRASACSPSCSVHWTVRASGSPPRPCGNPPSTTCSSR
jgi:ABC-2 type transport system ATP-binding protein